MKNIRRNESDEIKLGDFFGLVGACASLGGDKRKAAVFFCDHITCTNERFCN